MRKVLLAAVLALVVATCGGSDSDDGTPGEGSTTAAPQESSVVNIEIKDFAFDPAEVDIAEGTRIVWTNSDGVTHTVTGDEGVWAGITSGDIPEGGTYPFDMGAPGTFTYFCSIHPQMRGTIEVTG